MSMQIQTEPRPDTKPDPLIRLVEVRKQYEQQEILRNISLHVQKGEFVSILGPSGCGKSTLFNMIAGLVPVDGGTLSVRGDIGYMQQKDLLLPWKTILDNVVLPLDLKGLNKKVQREKAAAYIDMMGLGGYEGKYPYQLSGGMKQRASFLRTFLASEELMLLDEPFGALDSITKRKMQDWLLEIKNTLNLTILFITHDIEEALLLSDRIYVLSAKPGRVQEELILDFHNDDKQNRLLSERLLQLKAHILQIIQGA